MERKPVDLSSFTVALRKHVDPASPAPLRLLAAKGVVPMAPEEMALVLYQLSLDRDPRVVSAATETILKTPPAILSTAFSADVPPEVLDWAAELFSKNQETLNILVLNPVLADSTLESISRSAETATCDLIAENQVRLLKVPRIIEALYMNPKARMSTVDKLVDLARRNGVPLTGLPSIRGLLESTEPIVPSTPLPPQPPKDVEDHDALFAQFLAQSQIEEATQSESEPLDDEEKKAPASRMVFLSNLPVSQRIRFATLGNRDDRNFLIRDSNRLVHLAVVNSPKATEQDAINWSYNRSLPEGVISSIANHREWLRNYQVKVNLISNPKLPLQSALRILPHLLPRDLKALSTNRNIPHQLTRQAKELLNKRMSRTTS
ncbi:MAG: hypothetical protein JW797_11945 [Bradymonadales bacterium]|nr:hypothetical protein [Bradymonadales bacterium]